MSASVNRIPAVRVVGLIAIALAWLAVLPAGCDRAATLDTSLATAPALPEEMQGRWRFSRERTLAAWKATLAPEQYEPQMQFVAMIDKLGHPIHSDVRVTGASIVGDSGGGGLQPQYDFTEWGRGDALVRGNAWWHEDRHDPGDKAMQTLSLRVQEGVLLMGFGDGGEGTLWFAFERAE